MRLITVVTVSLLLAAAVPALGHPDRGGTDHTECETHENIDSYEGSLTVDRTLYARAGWWQGTGDGFAINDTGTSDDGTTDDNDWMCGGDGGTTDEGREAPVWLRLADAPPEPLDSSDRQPFEISVQVGDGAVAALDVFEYRARAGGWSHQMTPRCPQGLVADLPPEGGESVGSYVSRVLHETVDVHQRGNGGELTVTVDPDESVTGQYAVAIYPQAGASDAGSTEISWSIDTGSGTFDVDDGDDPPEMPLAATSWVLPLDRPFNCAEKLIQLPSTAQASELPTMPGGADIGDLFTSNLVDE